MNYANPGSSDIFNLVRIYNHHGSKMKATKYTCHACSTKTDNPYLVTDKKNSAWVYVCRECYDKVISAKQAGYRFNNGVKLYLIAD